MADWFTSLPFDSSDGPDFKAANALVREINSDPAWRAWWSGSPFKRLEVTPVPGEWPADQPIIQSRRKQFLLAQPCPELAVFTMSRPAPRVTPGWAEVYERLGHAVYDALSVGLDNVGKILDLGPGPGREESYARLPTPQPQILEDTEDRAAREHRLHDHHGHFEDGGPGVGDVDIAYETAGRLRAAHPRFTAHFRRRIYDADDSANDDTMPFGTDEGADTVSEWNDRADELTETTTLRSILGPDPEEWIDGRYWEDDDALIATGFSLLRFTGQIDPEGRRWLKDAVKRQVERGQGREYRRMRKDLKAYPNRRPG